MVSLIVFGTILAIVGSILGFRFWYTVGNYDGGNKDASPHAFTKLASIFAMFIGFVLVVNNVYYLGQVHQASGYDTVVLSKDYQGETVWVSAATTQKAK